MQTSPNLPTYRWGRRSKSSGSFKKIFKLSTFQSSILELLAGFEARRARYMLWTYGALSDSDERGFCHPRVDSKHFNSEYLSNTTLPASASPYQARLSPAVQIYERGKQSEITSNFGTIVLNIGNILDQEGAMLVWCRSCLPYVTV